MASLLRSYCMLDSFRYVAMRRVMYCRNVFHAKHATQNVILSGATFSQSSHKTEAVVFDMGGVILPSVLGEIIKNTAKKSSLPLVEFQKLFMAHHGEWAKLERGEILLPEFIDSFKLEVLNKMKADVDLTELFTAMGSYSRFQDIQPHPEMIDCIRCLRADKVKVALLTNNFKLSPTETCMPLDRSLFDVIVESCVVGLRKPEKQIYELCLSKLGLTPSNIIYLDDFGMNLKTASEMGIRTIKVTDISTALNDLQTMLGFGCQGFIPGTIAVPPTLQLPTENITKHLNNILSIQERGTPHIRCFRHGQSNPTYSIKYGSRTMVLRKKPPGKLLPSAHAIEREYQVMDAVGRCGVPVVELLNLCEDESVVGTPFYLMNYMEGDVFSKFALPNLTPVQRTKVYKEMAKVLSVIHRINISEANLSDFGKPDDYVRRNFTRWQKQYEASQTDDIKSMTKLAEWIPEHYPKSQQITVVHGDFRLDNLIYDTDSLTVKAVLDWELSTLGDPLTDLATCCLPYYLPESFPIIAGLAGTDIKSLGIPSQEEFIRFYCDYRGLSGIDNWSVYLVFVLYRFAAILQGVYKRALDGQASSPQAHMAGKIVPVLADLALGLTNDEAGVPTSSNDPTQKRHYSTLGRAQHWSTNRRMFSSSSQLSYPMPVTVSDIPADAQALHFRVREFIHDLVIPLEQKIRNWDNSTERWTPHPKISKLKEQAKSAGLWNLFLPKESDPLKQYSPGLTNLEYSFICEEMGKSPIASEIFNCNPPDTGNMEVLVKYGSDQQKEQWLRPLLDGRIRSCFAMTEPNVASSDAVNIEATITRQEDHYIVNGHKWWTSGALHPDCKFAIFLGKTDTTQPIHKQHSMIIVPMDVSGVKVIRPLSVFGFLDAPYGHGEVMFKDVHVPVENMILGEGCGFEIAQGRLGPGRVHHCMRLIGASERGLQLMVKRVKNRVAFGMPLADHGTIQADIAQSRIEIEQTRLLVLKAAHTMDLHGNKVAAPLIAMIKVATPTMAQTVLDRAIQAHGGAGLHSDLPLATLWSWARILRLADGPDEVHRRSLAKMEYKSSP